MLTNSVRKKGIVLYNYKLFRVYYTLHHCHDEDCAILCAHDEEEAKAKMKHLFRNDVSFNEISVIGDHESNFDAVAINPRAIYYLD